MSQLEDTIAQWTVEAAGDMGAPTTKLVAKWIARCAHAKGRMVLGERALKKLEAEDDACRFRGMVGGTDASFQIAMQFAPGDIAMGQARAEYAAGVELLEVAERVLAAMNRPRTASATKHRFRPCRTPGHCDPESCAANRPDGHPCGQPRSTAVHGEGGK